MLILSSNTYYYTQVLIFNYYTTSTRLIDFLGVQTEPFCLGIPIAA